MTEHAEHAELRVPVSVASRKGVSWLSEQARARRVVLTRFKNPQVVIDDAGRLDDTYEALAETRRLVTDHFADRAADRAGWQTLDEVCASLGIDIDRVRARAAMLADG